MDVRFSRIRKRSSTGNDAAKDRCRGVWPTLCAGGRKNALHDFRRNAVVLTIFGLTIVGLLASTGCQKQGRPKAPGPAPAAAQTAKESKTPPAPEASPAASVNAGPEGLGVQIDSAKQTVNVVASKQASAPLSDLLDRAAKANKEATGKAVKTWAAQSDVLSAQDVRDLLEASWNKDSAKATEVLRPWFVEKMTLEISDIPTLLTKAWEYDSNATRGVLRSWGDGYGFLDVSDSDAVTRHKFVAAEDVDQIRKAVREYHGNNWTQVAGIPLTGAAPGGATELLVQISWASHKWIGEKEMRFSSSNTKLLNTKLNSAVTLAPRNLPDAGIPVVVDSAVDMPEDWVQVRDEDFIALAAKSRNVNVPERGSKEWRSLLGLGVLSGSIYF